MGGWLAKAEKDAVHAEKDAVHVEKDAIHIEKEAFNIGTGAFQFFNALESFKLVEAGAFKDAFQFASTININLSAVPLVIVCMTFILCHFLLNISTEKLWLLLGTIFGISLAAYTVFLVIFANISPRSDVKLGSLATTFVFVGMPGMGKSWIINCLAGYDACRSGLAVTGNTNKVQSVKSRNDFHTFVDSPGLNEVGKKGQFTAKEVGKAVKLNGRVKYLFTMGTRNGRVREDDLATVSHVMRSLPPYTPFGLILNQLSREEYSFVMENFETYEKIVRCTLVHDYAASVGEEADNNQIYAEPPIFALPEYGGLWQRMFRRVTLPWPFIDFLANKCEAAEMDPAKVKDLKAAGREGHIQQVKDLYNDLQSTYEKIQTAKDDAKDAKEQNKVFQQKLDDALNAKKLSQEKYQKKELAPKERPVNGKYVLVNEGSQKVIDKDLCVVNRDPTKPAVESTVWLVQKAVAAEESADTYNLYSSDNKLLKCTSPGVLCLVENTPANADQDSCKWRVTETTRSHKGYWALKNKDTKFTIDNWFGQTGKNGAALKCEKSQEHHIPYLGGHTWKFMVVKKDD